MKKIILSLMLVLCFSGTAYAFEDTHKISDLETHQQLLNNFKSYTGDDVQFYTAKTIISNILKMDREHISDYFQTEFETYYTNPQDKGVGIKGMSDIKNHDRKFHFYAEIGDETDMIFDIFRNDEIWNNKDIKEAYPLCILTAEGKFSNVCIWVKYQNGNESILTDFIEQDGKWNFSEYSDKEYMEEFIIPEVKGFEPKSISGFSDCDDIHVNTLLRLGFVSGFEDGSFRPQKILTRAEGIKLAVCVGLPKNYVQEAVKASYYVPIFSDVTEEHWSASFITLAAKSMGSLDGFEDKTLRPEDTLTKIQFAKILVCALGFEKEAKAEGGYPKGYKETAEKLGLGTDIDETPVSRADAAQMIYKALLANVNTVDGYDMSGEAITQVVSKKSSCMEYVHNIRKVSGVLKTDGGNIVTVGNESFLAGFNDAEDFSGEKKTHFIQKNENGLEEWIASE